MTKLVPLAVLALAALGACSSPPPSKPTNVVTNVHPYQAGNGVVQNVYPAPAGAAAGGTSQPMQRLEIKMDKGTVQYVDTASRDFTKGTRVTLTEDRVIRKM